MKSILLGLLTISCVHNVISRESQVQGRLIRQTLESQKLRNKIGESHTRGILIYTPPSYSNNSSTVRFPVLYLLHSYGETPDSWIKSPYTQGLNIQSTMDSLIAKGDIREMIVVMPDCSNRYGGSWYTNSETTGLWVDFIAGELVNFIDKNYHTLANSSSRGIAGHSMGGYGALKIAMKRPDVFGFVYAMSSVNLVSDKIANLKYGELLTKLNDHAELSSYTLFDKLVFSKALAFVPNDMPPCYCDYLYTTKNEALTRDENVWERWSGHLLVNQIDEFKNKGLPLTISFDHGSKDFLVSESREFSRQLREQGIEHEFSEFAGDHTNQFRLRFESFVLPFFSDHLK